MSVYEQSVIGACMLDSGAFWRVCDRITDADFREPMHALLWRAIDENMRAGRAADAVTLGDWLETNGIAETVGGTRYAWELANTTHSATNVVAYADIVARDAALRCWTSMRALIARRSDAQVARMEKARGLQ